MKFEFNIRNLGRIRNATIEVSPFTVLAGPNSAGKSFFTKSLYSFLKSAKQDYVSIFLNQFTRKLKMYGAWLQINLPRQSQLEAKNIRKFDAITVEIDSILNNIVCFNLGGSELINDLNVSSEQISLKITEAEDALRDLVSSIKNQKKLSNIQKVIDVVRSDLIRAKAILSRGGWKDYVNTAWGFEFHKTLLNNFQEQNLNDLKSDSNIDEILFEIPSVGKIQFNNKSLLNSLNYEYINNFLNLNQLIYLESPVYWKLKQPLERLKMSDSERSHSMLSPKARNEVLSGVPEHFYDLIHLIELRLKVNNLSEDGDKVYEKFKEITGQINKIIGGQIKLNHLGEIGFIPKNKNKMLSLHAAASGVTAYGIISLLIEKGVITPGSFIFIDEPEVNLHPAWQVCFIKHLFNLSKLGVNILIATHSNDVMQCIENIMEENEDLVDKGHFSINRLSEEGISIDKEKDLYQRVAAIKNDLTKPLIDMLIGSIDVNNNELVCDGNCDND